MLSHGVGWGWLVQLQLLLGGGILSGGSHGRVVVGLWVGEATCWYRDLIRRRDNLHGNCCCTGSHSRMKTLLVLVMVSLWELKEKGYRGIQSVGPVGEVFVPVAVVSVGGDNGGKNGLVLTGKFDLS